MFTDECCLGAKRFWHLIYRLSYILTAQQASRYASHRTLNNTVLCLSLEWMLRNAVRFCQMHSALQLAVEHMPECTDRWKIKNTAGHVIQNVSGDYTDFYLTGKFVLRYVSPFHRPRRPLGRVEV